LDEKTLKSAVRKADKTRKLIESYQEYWAELDVDLWKLFCNTRSDEKEKREDIYREYHAARALRAKLERVVNEGRKAEEELSQRKRNGNGSSARTSGSP